MKVNYFQQKVKTILKKSIFLQDFSKKKKKANLGNDGAIKFDLNNIID